MATISGPAEEPDAPSVWPEEKEKGKVPHRSFPSWKEVLHPSQTMILAGQAPLTLSELSQQHCSWSVGGRESPALKSRRI